MLLKNLTGVAAINETFNKGFSTLVIATDNALAGTERLSLFVESSSGNRYIFNDMALIDILALASFQDDALLQYHGGLGRAYAIELTQDAGFIGLLEGEQIRLKGTGFDPLTVHNFYGLESVFSSTNLYVYEEKIFPIGEKNRSYDVTGYDLASFNAIGSITDITLRHDNGTTVKLTAEELAVTSRCLNANLGYSDCAEFADNAVMPLAGFNQMEVTKPSANQISICLRIDAQDYAKNFRK